MSHELWHDVHRFLAHEAWLLDERRVEEWVDLFTDDAHYWMPVRSVVRRDQTDKELARPGDMAYFDETKETLRVRIERLKTGMAWAEDPPSRTRHIIANLEVESGDRPSEVKARSAILVYRTTLAREVDILAGTRNDLLRTVNGEWKIARRTIILDQAVLTTKNLSTFF